MTDECLIYEVKKYALLYDKGSTDYRNKAKRDKAWEEIGTALGNTANACKHRWKSIRDRYVRECAGKEYGFVTTDREWDMFNHLGFLRDHIRIGRQQKRRKTDDCESIQDALIEDSTYVIDDYEENDIKESIEVLSTSSQSSTQDNVSCESYLTNSLPMPQDEQERPTASPSEKRYSGFLKHLCEKLDELPYEELEDMKLYILTYVYNKVKEVKNEKSLRTIIVYSDENTESNN